MYLQRKLRGITFPLILLRRYPSVLAFCKAQAGVIIVLCTKLQNYWTTEVKLLTNDILPDLSLMWVSEGFRYSAAILVPFQTTADTCDQVDFPVLTKTFSNGDKWETLH